MNNKTDVREIIAYYTGHEKADKICLEIAYTAGIRALHVKDYIIDTIPIVYGLFRGTDVAMRKAMWSNVPFLYIDHGYFGWKHYDGYYRINKSWTFFHARMHGVGVTSTKPNRLYKLGLSLESMKPNKGKIAVICKPSFEGSMHLPITRMWPEEFVAGTRYYLEQNGFAVFVSTKTEGNRLNDLLAKYDVDLVVGHDSVVIVDALVQGYNVLNVSITNPFEITDEESRQAFFAMLANTQYKLSEITKDVLNNLLYVNSEELVV